MMKLKVPSTPTQHNVQNVQDIPETLGDLSEKIRISDEQTRQNLEKERIDLAKSYIRYHIAKRAIAEVVCLYVSDSNITDIQHLIKEGKRTASVIKDIISTLNTDKELAIGQEAVDSLSNSLTFTNIFEDDGANFSINPLTRESNLNSFLINRKGLSEIMKISAIEVGQDRTLVREQAQSMLNHVRRELEPLLIENIRTIAQNAASNGAQIIGKSQRVKNVDSLIKKMESNHEHGWDHAIGDMNDILGGRIVVRDLISLEQVMQEVEKFYGEQGYILDKSNKYVVNSGKNNSYRAIHYTIKLNDSHCFELQIKTESSMISADLLHNVIYKPDILNLPPEKKQAVIEYSWRSLYKELMSYKEYINGRSTPSGIE